MGDNLGVHVTSFLLFLGHSGCLHDMMQFVVQRQGLQQQQQVRGLAEGMAVYVKGWCFVREHDNLCVAMLLCAMLPQVTLVHHSGASRWCEATALRGGWWVLTL